MIYNIKEIIEFIDKTMVNTHRKCKLWEKLGKYSMMNYTNEISTNVLYLLFDEKLVREIQSNVVGSINLKK
jgi:hypothetical protein